MATTTELSFEVERRIILFHRDTTMPDDTQLGYTGDPNSASNGATAGQTLLYNSPSGAKYLDKSTDPYERWAKVQDTAGGTWVSEGSSTSTGLLIEVETFTLDATDISNMYVTITYAPDPAEDTKLEIKNACGQHYGDDYKQNSLFLKRIEWESMDLEGVLIAGDKLTITYTR